MTANNNSDENIVEESREKERTLEQGAVSAAEEEKTAGSVGNNGSSAVRKKKKKRRRTIDKAKVAENKKKAKARKKRQKEQLKAEKARNKAEKAETKAEKERSRTEKAGKGRPRIEKAKAKAKAENDKSEAEKKNVGESVESSIAVEEINVTEEGEAKKKPGDRKRIWMVVGIAAAVLLLVGSGSFLGLRHYWIQLETADDAVEAMVHTEAVELAEYSMLQHKKEYVKQHAGKSVPKALLDAARYVLEGVKNRPPEIELTEENAADFAKIENCVINTSTGKVDITMSAEGLAISDDGYYYLFEEKIYENALSGEDYIVEDQKDVELTFSVNLNYNSASSRLFSKFVVAVKKDGKFMAISRPRHITNPEVIARYSPSFGSTSSKKGLLVDPEKLSGSELDDLGVKHAAYNIPLSRLLGNTTHASYPTVYYSYNGRNYAFNGQVVAEYDYIFSTLTNKGITITAILLNDMNPGHMDLIHPRARSGGAGSPYFAFNAADSAGTEYIAAVGSFLASRYAGTGHGKVMNWVIGNEINARKEWNYIEAMDTASYVEEYAKAFRVFYNAILSINGNARVYISLDQQWARSLYSNGGFGSKEILDEFNRNISSSGNIDWGVAQHPYNYPLTSAKAWSGGNKISNSESTPVITIKNIHVLTDYLQKEAFRTDSGEVRHVILSEMGYTSSAGQELQAASFVYAYKVIEANRYIDSMLFSRQTDAPAELAQGLALGIDTLGGGHKSIYNAFKYVDTAESAAYTDFALRVIGVGSWGEIISRH